MKLKGNMVVELTDVNTSEVETFTEENMVTNAVNNILGLNPMGIFYAASGQYDDAVLWNDTLLPICPNMIGGFLRRWRKTRIIFMSGRIIYRWLMPRIM